jgi:hypothetical protein
MQQRLLLLLSNKLFTKIASGFPGLFLFDIKNTQSER